MYLYVEERSTTWTTVWEDANYNNVLGTTSGAYYKGQSRSSQYCSTFPMETFGKEKTHVYFGLWQKRAARISSDQN